MGPLRALLVALAAALPGAAALFDSRSQCDAMCAVGDCEPAGSGGQFACACRSGWRGAVCGTKWLTAGADLLWSVVALIAICAVGLTLVRTGNALLAKSFRGEEFRAPPPASPEHRLPTEPLARFAQVMVGLEYFQVVTLALSVHVPWPPSIRALATVLRGALSLRVRSLDEEYTSLWAGLALATAVVAAAVVSSTLMCPLLKPQLHAGRETVPGMVLRVLVSYLALPLLVSWLLPLGCVLHPFQTELALDGLIQPLLPSNGLADCFAGDDGPGLLALGVGGALAVAYLVLTLPIYVVLNSDHEKPEPGLWVSQTYATFHHQGRAAIAVLYVAFGETLPHAFLFAMVLAGAGSAYVQLRTQPSCFQWLNRYRAICSGAVAFASGCALAALALDDPHSPLTLTVGVALILGLLSFAGLMCSGVLKEAAVDLFRLGRARWRVYRAGPRPSSSASGRSGVSSAVSSFTSGISAAWRRKREQMGGVAGGGGGVF